MKSIAAGMFLFTIVLGTTACGPKLIPNVGIELTDTPDHRAIVELMERFQKAFESRDVDGLVGLASKDFFETSGTLETNDDYNYDGLRQHFTKHFERIKECTLQYQLRDVKVEADRATVDYHYTTRYLMSLPAGDKWQISDDINRMELARQESGWKVVSGL